MTQDWTLEEALAYYRRQGAPGEQGALVALLREVQEERGGALPAADLAEIAAALSLRDTFLSAIIRRYPGLRTEEAPHRLELCGGPRCSGGARLLWPPLWRRPTACARAASVPAAASPTASPAV